MNITIINGAGQIDYMFGLVSGLAANKDDKIDVIDVDIAKELFEGFDNVNYFPAFRHSSLVKSLYKKVWYRIKYYAFLVKYLLGHRKRIIHFQWLDRIKFLDRLIIPTIAWLRGHKIVYTVHNINAGKRDGNDSLFNRYSLKYIYRLSHRLLVHNSTSKKELCNDFKVPESKVFIVKHGINNRVSSADISPREAKTRLKIDESTKTMLFFGYIDHYKGLDLLIQSLDFLPENITDNFRLIIAGRVKNNEYSDYLTDIINKTKFKAQIIFEMNYIPDEEVEIYFKAADCIILPYRNIYQSGVIFMAYTFGLPMIVTDISNFRDDVIEGMSGMLIQEVNPEKIAETITRFYNSSLYKNLPDQRKKIIEWGINNYSWEAIGKETRKIYSGIID